MPARSFRFRSKSILTEEILFGKDGQDHLVSIFGRQNNLDTPLFYNVKGSAFAPLAEKDISFLTRMGSGRVAKVLNILRPERLE